MSDGPLSTAFMARGCPKMGKADINQVCDRMFWPWILYSEFKRCEPRGLNDRGRAFGRGALGMGKASQVEVLPWG